MLSSSRVTTIDRVSTAGWIKTEMAWRSRYANLKKQLEESLKEKDDLKLKLEKFETSSKNLTNMINSQISPKDKTGLGYDSQLNERDLNNKSNVFKSAFDSSVNESKEDNNQANDRYKAGEGYDAVPPPYTRNFMPPKPDLSVVTEIRCTTLRDKVIVTLSNLKGNNVRNFVLKD
nr:hypothetical protein [Tanacetum cinerariifolium]GEX25705.1 hypothetical protein [Tanacetum cinerariifolium]